MDADMDDDGEIRLVLDGAKVFGDVDAERSLFILKAVWSVQAAASRNQVLELCNRVNDGLIMIRCSLPEVFEEPALFVDFTIDTKGGITGEEIVDATRRFVKLCQGIGRLDEDEILM